MTREEIVEAVRPKGQPEIMAKMFEEVVDYVLNNYGDSGMCAIESQLKELQEPKTCNGCAYYNDFFKGGCSTNHSCIRKSTDHYEPKQ